MAESEGNSNSQRGETAQMVFISNPLLADPGSDWSPIHDAAYNGRLLPLRHAIEQVNIPSVDGATPLSEACTNGKAACVRLLLQHGASPWAFNASSACPSPIHQAAAKGASVNCSGNGDSPLHIASQLSNPELVKTLLDHGADHEAKNRAGKRPVDMAPANSDVVKILTNL